MATSLFSTQALAEGSGLYLGVDVAQNSNSFDANGNTVDIDSGDFKIKFGTVSDSGWRIQGYVQFETYDKTLFDAKNDELLELGVEIIKGFEITPEFSPFIQVGLGFGSMEVEGYSEDSIGSYSLSAGVGVMYKIVPAFEILAGVDYQYRTWQEIDYGFTTLSAKETTTKLYAGANFHF